MHSDCSHSLSGQHCIPVWVTGLGVGEHGIRGMVWGWLSGMGDWSGGGLSGGVWRSCGEWENRGSGWLVALLELGLPMGLEYIRPG